MSLLWSQTGSDGGCRTDWNVTAVLGRKYSDLECSHEECGIWSGLTLRLFKTLVRLKPKATSSGHDLDQVSEAGEAVMHDG